MGAFEMSLLVKIKSWPLYGDSPNYIYLLVGELVKS